MAETTDSLYRIERKLDALAAQLKHLSLEVESAKLAAKAAEAAVRRR